MGRLSALFLFVCTWSFPVQAEETLACPQPDPPATSQEFVAWLDCTMVELLDVWNENVIPGILLAHPGIEALHELELIYVSDCDFSPRLEDANGDGQMDVVFNTRLMIPQMAASQAILWYLVAPEGTVSPEAHLAYINSHLLPSVREDARVCSQENRTGRYSMVPIANVFAITPEDHPIFLGLDTAQVRKIGNYVGILPSFAALIHEAGHSALHQDGPTSVSIQARELEADGFAADVFSANDLPMTLGLAHLLLAYDLDRGGSNPQIACRILALATRYEVPASRELGTETLGRIIALRQAYAAYYGPLCTD